MRTIWPETSVVIRESIDDGSMGGRRREEREGRTIRKRNEGGDTDRVSDAMQLAQPRCSRRAVFPAREPIRITILKITGPNITTAGL